MSQSQPALLCLISRRITARCQLPSPAAFSANISRRSSQRPLHPHHQPARSTSAFSLPHRRSPRHTPTTRIPSESNISPPPQPTPQPHAPNPHHHSRYHPSSLQPPPLPTSAHPPHPTPTPQTPPLTPHPPPTAAPLPPHTPQPTPPPAPHLQPPPHTPPHYHHPTTPLSHHHTTTIKLAALRSQRDLPVHPPRPQRSAATPHAQQRIAQRSIILSLPSSSPARSAAKILRLSALPPARPAAS